ncbi:PQQ-binding-like beta-propeller repeat protein, partial [Planctomycetota bacterium]
ITGMYPGKNDIVISTEQNLYSISAKGTKKWKVQRAGSLLWKPVADEDIILFKETEKKLAAVSRSDGKVLWTMPTRTLTGSPVIGQDYIYISTYVKSKKDGKEEQTFSVNVPSPDNKDLSKELPGAQDLLEEISMGITSQGVLTPVLKAVDKKTGKVKWVREKAGGDIACIGETVYAIQRLNNFSLVDQKIGTTNRVSALEADSGNLLWEYEHRGAIDSFVADSTSLFIGSHEETTRMTFSVQENRSKLGNKLSCISTVW